MATKKPSVKTPAKSKKKSVEKGRDAPGFLPINGIAPKIYPALDKLCKAYLESEAKANKAKVEKKEKHILVMGAMQERELDVYIHEDSGETFYADITCKIKHRNADKEAPKQQKEKNGINPTDTGPADKDDLDGEEVELEVKTSEEIPEEEPATVEG